MTTETRRTLKCVRCGGRVMWEFDEYACFVCSNRGTRQPTAEEMAAVEKKPRQHGYAMRGFTSAQMEMEL